MADIKTTPKAAKIQLNVRAPEEFRVLLKLVSAYRGENLNDTLIFAFLVFLEALSEKDEKLWELIEVWYGDFVYRHPEYRVG